jgi:hypothetical protein
MLIDDSNAYLGNRAMAWVLLLYYHLLREGGITNDQTVYVDSEEFNAFEYVAVEVSPDQQPDIDQKLIRRGAVIYLLCELNDMVADYEADYLNQPFTQRVLSALASASAVAAIPEVAEIAEEVSKVQAPLVYSVFQGMLQKVFTTYVVEELGALAARDPA